MTSKTAAQKSSKTKPLKQAAAPTGDVEAFLAALDHPFKAEIVAVRDLFLHADPAIAEGMKWNAPSFRTTEYFATVNLRAKLGTAVVLHFGAKKSAHSDTGVSIPDPAELLAWLAKDRAIVTFRDLADIQAKQSALTALIRHWIKHVGV